MVGRHAESSSAVGSGCVDFTGDSSEASAFVGSDVVEGEVGMSGNTRCSILVGDAAQHMIPMTTHDTTIGKLGRERYRACALKQFAR